MVPRNTLLSISLAVALSQAIAGCNSGKSADSPPAAAPSSPPSTASNTGTSTPPTPKPADDGAVPSRSGVEKQKPAAGKANVQGKVLYNGKPAAGVEVKLAEKFNRFLGQPQGATFLAKTDSNGEYLIKDVPAQTYEGLLVKVFDSPYYQFATSGFVGAAKYKLDPDHTFFAPDTNLFKGDLKLLSPRAGSKIAPNNIEVKWAPYPDAAYYKFSIHADSSSGAKTEFDYIDKRVDGQSYTLDKPLTPGSYSCSVSAYNANDIKLSESPSDIKFSVK